MTSEIFGDPFAATRASAFLDALQNYVADGHPITEEDGTEPDVPPSLNFIVQGDIFEGYLQAQGLEFNHN